MPKQPLKLNKKSLKISRVFPTRTKNVLLWLQRRAWGGLPLQPQQHFFGRGLQNPIHTQNNRGHFGHFLWIASGGGGGRLGSLGLSWAPLGSPGLSGGLSWARLGSPGLSLGSPGPPWALLGSPGLSLALLVSWGSPGSPGTPCWRFGQGGLEGSFLIAISFQK